MAKLNSGIIYTNDLCIGCNKCISGCPVLGANVVVFDEKKQTHHVVVNPDICILCGHCIKNCMHNARVYHDDTSRFFDDLAEGKDISVIVAPALLSNYSKEYNSILGYLKYLGVQHIYSASFGADIATWAYLKYIEENNCSGMISQPCPPVVSYIERNRPELIDKLVPIQSAVVCTAIYARRYLNDKNRIAVITPCVAKKFEIEDENTNNMIQYNVTFEKMMEEFGEKDISEFHAYDELAYGLGSLYSMGGGMTKNMELYIGFDKVIVQARGTGVAFPYLDHYDINEEQLPYLVEIMSCTNGCNFGNATTCGVQLSNDISFSAHQQKEHAYNSGNVPKAFSNKERFEQLENRFSGFDLKDFKREYNRKAYNTREKIKYEDIERIFKSMYKITVSDRHKDCGACGYRTCLDMVYAIYVGVNRKENCLDYSKEYIRRENEKINSLMKSISMMNEELKASAQMKSDFLANMSHEIRTPMNAVIGMTELVLRGNLPEKERSYIQQIRSSGKSLLTIINDILDFSKIEAGKMQLTETNYEIMSIINDSINIVNTRIGEKNVHLLFDIDPMIPAKLYGDDIRIKQVLINLANNAVKFTENGFVLIKLRFDKCDDGIMMKFSVQDSGIGIKEEDMAKLFKSFQQVDSKRNRNIEGTGLGLAISSQLVSLMHGKIDVESIYGEGSCFSFEIPQKIVDETPAAALKNPDKNYKSAVMFEDVLITENFKRILVHYNASLIECRNLEQLKNAVDEGAAYIFVSRFYYTDEIKEYTKSLDDVTTVLVTDSSKYISDNISDVREITLPLYAANIAAIFNNEETVMCSVEHSESNIKFTAPDAEILIIDDNSINLTVAEGLLNPLNMKITKAGSASEAFEILQNKRFDIIFMDHMMPVIDGVEATHIIRSMEEEYYQTVPIIALTANAMSGAKEMFLAEGMNDFVAKPIEMMDITSKLQKWLPHEKIIRSVEKKDEPQPEQEKIPVIEGLDTAAGVAITGSVKLYMKVLEDYYKAIEKKSNLIEQHLKDGDIKGYTVEVHALKSSSKLVGATELSEMAAVLEKCGHEENKAQIEKDTPALLELYRDHEKIIQPYFKKEIDNSPKEKMTAESLNAMLNLILDKLDDFDIDSVRIIIDKMKEFSYDDSVMFEELCTAVEAVDYDSAENAARKWLS